jgi:N-terminal TM domain of oligopeptide transport permease C
MPGSTPASARVNAAPLAEPPGSGPSPSAAANAAPRGARAEGIARSAGVHDAGSLVPPESGSQHRDFRRALLLFRRNRMALAGLAIIMLFALVALLAP